MFHAIKFTGTIQTSYIDFTIRNSLGNLANERYHPSNLIADAMQNPWILSILGWVLKSKAVEGAFEQKDIYD